MCNFQGKVDKKYGQVIHKRNTESQKAYEEDHLINKITFLT